MYHRTETGLYVPRHHVIDPMTPEIKIAIDYIANHDKKPLEVHRKDGVTVLVQHKGTPAEGIIPHFLTDMTIPEQHVFFRMFDPTKPLDLIRADWRKHLHHLLWMRSLEENIPPQARWEG